MGLLIPQKVSKLSLVIMLVSTKRKLKGRQPADLLKLPPMADNPAVQHMQLLLSDIATSSFYLGQSELASVANMHMLHLSLQHGITLQTPHAVASFGATTSHLGKMRLAYEYGKVAVEIMDHLEVSETYAKVGGSANVFTLHLGKPMKNLLEGLEHSCLKGMEVGEVRPASMVWRGLNLMCILVGMRLPDLERYVQTVDHLHISSRSRTYSASFTFVFLCILQAVVKLSVIL